TASDLLPQGEAGRDQPSTPSRLNDSDRHAIATSIVTLMPRQFMEYPTIWLGRQPVLDDLHRGQRQLEDQLPVFHELHFQFFQRIEMLLTIIFAEIEFDRMVAELCQLLIGPLDSVDVRGLRVVVDLGPVPDNRSKQDNESRIDLAERIRQIVDLRGEGR